MPSACPKEAAVSSAKSLPSTLPDMFLNVAFHSLTAEARFKNFIDRVLAVYLIPREFPVCEGGGESKEPRSGSGEARIT